MGRKRDITIGQPLFPFCGQLLRISVTVQISGHSPCRFHLHLRPTCDQKRLKHVVIPCFSNLTVTCTCDYFNHRLQIEINAVVRDAYIDLAVYLDALVCPHKHGFFNVYVQTKSTSPQPALWAKLKTGAYDSIGVYSLLGVVGLFTAANTAASAVTTMTILFASSP